MIVIVIVIMIVIVIVIEFEIEYVIEFVIVNAIDCKIYSRSNKHNRFSSRMRSLIVGALKSCSNLHLAYPGCHMFAPTECLEKATYKSCSLVSRPNVDDKVSPCGKRAPLRIVNG